MATATMKRPFQYPPRRAVNAADKRLQKWQRKTRGMEARLREAIGIVSAPDEMPLGVEVGLDTESTPTLRIQVGGRDTLAPDE